MDKPIRQYIQGLIIDTVTAVTCLDTTDILHESLLNIIYIKNQRDATWQYVY
jgi:hypothetical protein